jgi:hydrogenase maturation protease
VNVLVAGLGNIFLGDDGFGVEVARRLQARTTPEGVRVADFGIRGVHLAYELLAGYDALVLIDAMPLGEEPGTVAVIEPDLASLSAGRDPAAPVMDAHSMDPAVVLGLLADLGGSIDRVLIVACQPAELAEGIGLSVPVAEAVDAAIDAVDDVVAGLCRGMLAAGREESHT